MVTKVHGGVITDQTLAGSLRYFEIDGGAADDEFTNTIADGNQRAVEGEVAAGGTGYTVDDTLTLVGGTGTAPTFTVRVIGGGGATGPVVGVSVASAGDLSAVPANPATTSGGTGSGATLNVEYSSTIIIPNGSNGPEEFFVGVGAPVVGSAADQTLAVIAERATIVQIAIISDAVIQVAVENTGFGWIVTDNDLRDAIRALGTITVPDTTTDGGSVDLSGATVTEKFFSDGIA